VSAEGQAPPPLTVVLPVYDERASLEPALERYRRAFVEQGLGDAELLVVDDGSRDGSGELAEALAAAWATSEAPAPRAASSPSGGVPHSSDASLASDPRLTNDASPASTVPRLRVLRHSVNRGQVAALRTGFAAARGTVVTHNGIDLPFAPERTREVLAPFAAGADVVVVERANRGGNGAWRTVVSWGNVLAWKLLFGSPFADHNFVQLFRREVLAALPVVSRGVNTVTAELLLRAYWAGCRVVRMRAPYEQRRTGKSSIRPRTVVRAVKEVVRLRLLLRRRNALATTAATEPRHGGA
jgi:glycosyltransferase involved in cell wall biosynthesis